MIESRAHGRSARLFCLAAITGAATSIAAAQPNVIIFFVDDMGYADWQFDARSNPTGSHVYETPNMLRLASEGVTFLNNYASAPVCSPSRASLMTGKSVAKHAISDFIGGSTTASGTLVRTPPDWVQNVGFDEVLLPEALRDAGYRTGTFGKWHLGQTGNPASNPLTQGFEFNIAGVASGNPGFAGGFFAGADGAWAGMPGLNIPGTYATTEFLSDAISTQAASYISQRAEADEPFFVFMPHYVVHTPIEAPAALIAYYQSKINSLPPALVNGHTDARYAAMVQKMDESLGRILDTLDDPDGDPESADSIRDNTIVVFTSDNGGLTNFAVTDNRPLRDGKGSLYEGGIREPLIISYTGNPSITPNTVLTDAVAVTHDMYPTVLEWTGVAGDPAQNAAMDGISLVPTIEGGPPTTRDIIWHYPHRSPQSVTANGPVGGGAWVSAIRRDRHKLMYFFDERRFEMYDLAADIGETVDIFDPADPLASDLSRSLYEYLRAVRARLPLDIGNELPLPGSALAMVPEDLTGDVFDTDFAQPQSFLQGETGSSGFDTVLNASAASALDQSISTPGTLTFRNAGFTRIVAGDIASPVLFRQVTGNFDAIIQINSMEEANFHVVAMLIADPSDPANEFIWVGQQNRTGTNDFAQSRNIVAGARAQEAGEPGVYPYYRVIRKGDSFVAFHSVDGLVWVPFVEYDRPDLPSTLQVGVTQSLFSSALATATIGRFIIGSACLADIAEPLGVLDLADVVSFANAFTEGQPTADFDQNGIFDLADVSAFVASFLAGCQETRRNENPVPASAGVAASSSHHTTQRAVLSGGGMAPHISPG